MVPCTFLSKNKTKQTKNNNKQTKLGHLIFLEKVQKMPLRTNIPILCTPNNDLNCAKTNNILHIGILVNKQYKIHVHSNNKKGLKDNLIN